MSRLRFNKITTPTVPAANKGEVFYSSTLSPAALAFQNESTKVFRLGGLWTNASTGAVGGPFSSDTYMTGSSINIGTTGMWQAGMIYECHFDMTKTAAGTAAPVVIVRMGTAASTGDATILTLTGPAQTGAADTGVAVVTVEFRSIGSGTAAVIAGGFKWMHNLGTTGLTGSAQVSTDTAASSGFDSTTSNIIGVSFNGGASFSGTNVYVHSRLFV
jgi:hypothetical protein